MTSICVENGKELNCLLIVMRFNLKNKHYFNDDNTDDMGFLNHELTRDKHNVFQRM